MQIRFIYAPLESLSPAIVPDFLSLSSSLHLHFLPDNIVPGEQQQVEISFALEADFKFVIKIHREDSNHPSHDTMSARERFN